MHGFGTGVSMPKKRANWEHLLKLLRKAGVRTVDEAVADALMRCDEGAAAALVNEMYEELTQRRLQKVARRPKPEKAPFARATKASAAAVDEEPSFRF